MLLKTESAAVLFHVPLGWTLSIFMCTIASQNNTFYSCLNEHILLISVVSAASKRYFETCRKYIFSDFQPEYASCNVSWEYLLRQLYRMQDSYLMESHQQETKDHKYSHINKPCKCLSMMLSLKGLRCIIK